MPRNLTNRLLRAEDGGAVIVTNEDEHPVSYAPRADLGHVETHPWMDSSGGRYCGTDLKATAP